MLLRTIKKELTAKRNMKIIKLILVKHVKVPAVAAKYHLAEATIYSILYRHDAKLHKNA